MGRVEKIVCWGMTLFWCIVGSRAVYSSAANGDWVTAATVFMACAGMAGANIAQLRGAKLVWGRK